MNKNIGNFIKCLEADEVRVLLNVFYTLYNDMEEIAAKYAFSKTPKRTAEITKEAVQCTTELRDRVTRILGMCREALKPAEYKERQNQDFLLRGTQNGFMLADDYASWEEETLKDGESQKPKDLYE